MPDRKNHMNHIWYHPVSTKVKSDTTFSLNLVSFYIEMSFIQNKARKTVSKKVLDGKIYRGESDCMAKNR